METTRTRSIRRRLGSATGDFLARTGQLWVGNPGVLVVFFFRLLRAAGQSTQELGSRRIGRVGWVTLSALWANLLRGLLDVVLVSAVIGIGLRLVGAQLGSLILPRFESAVLPTLVRDAMPLGLAIQVAARTGAPLSMKLAIRPLTHGDADAYRTKRELNYQVLPQLFAVSIATFCFYLLGAYVLFVGYTLDGGALHWRYAADFVKAIDGPGLGPLWGGSWRAFLFGGIVAYIACALGIEAAETLPHDPRDANLHNAAWESTVTAVVVCSILTVLFRSPF